MQVRTPPRTDTLENCYHCGEISGDSRWFQDKPFCCSGCLTVYGILHENNLCEYYSLDKKPGITRHNAPAFSYEHLDEQTLRSKLLEFDSASFARIALDIPNIHCISCIWLLENLQRINTGVMASEVNFTAKKVKIDFNPEKISISQLARQLDILGYPPRFGGDESGVHARADNKILIAKIAVAGFAFGNIMLMSFPDYLGLDKSDAVLQPLFSLLNIALALPVMLFSARGYFTNGFRSFTQRRINIDLPIAAGLLTLFLRSVYNIAWLHEPGFLDSLTGLVFFLLIGRWFQEITYQRLAFDRDYTSYFPLAVQKWNGTEWTPCVIHALKENDLIRVLNQEIIPADGIVNSSVARIDYSFVTGEAKTVKVRQGDVVYAGGKSTGEPITVTLTKKSTQSHLTSLWNSPAFSKTDRPVYQETIDKAARYFTWVVIVLGLVTGAVWYFIDPARMWLILTSVLMVACPCALALVVPFTYGTFLRVFGKNNFYLKNASVIERMAAVDTVVFDKTGTITSAKDPVVDFEGELNPSETAAIRSLAKCSSHPLSKIISVAMAAGPVVPVSDFEERTGSGTQGVAGGHFVKIGSAEYVGYKGAVKSDGTVVFAAVDDEIRGYFAVSVRVRENIRPMLQRLGRKCEALLSGDNENDRHKMSLLFGAGVRLIFRQTPQDKMDYIGILQNAGKNVLMIGDGLNDAGALKQSDVGIAVTDDTGIFTPACDGIILGDNLPQLDRFMELAKSSVTILKAGFTLSFIYNFIALTFAVTGHLTPLVAAILMPASSITVVVFSTTAVSFMAARKLKRV